MWWMGKYFLNQTALCKHVLFHHQQSLLLVHTIYVCESGRSWCYKSFSTADDFLIIYNHLHLYHHVMFWQAQWVMGVLLVWVTVTVLQKRLHQTVIPSLCSFLCSYSSSYSCPSLCLFVCVVVPKHPVLLPYWVLSFFPMEQKGILPPNDSYILLSRCFTSLIKS